MPEIIITGVMRAVAVLDQRLRAAGVPFIGVSMGPVGYTVSYDPAATPQQITAGEAIVAAFDVEDAIAELAAARAQVAFDRQTIVDRANDILADAAAGIAACDVDVVTIASGLTAANAMTSLTQAKPIIIGILNVLNRIVDRQDKHIAATADLTKLARHLAQG